MRFWSSFGFNETWQLRHVPRWVAIVANRRQSVAEHEHGVMVIAKLLMEWHPAGKANDFRLGVFELALGHDKDESLTGDIPSPNKRPSLATGMTQEQILLKCADNLEALAFLREEILLGNRRLEGVWLDVLGRFSEWYVHLGLYEWEKTETGEFVETVMEFLGLSESAPTFPLLKAINK